MEVVSVAQDAGVNCVCFCWRRDAGDVTGGLWWRASLPTTQEAALQAGQMIEEDEISRHGFTT